MKRLSTLSLFLCLAILSRGNNTHKPWTFWYWMYGAVSEAGIKADLQAMKDIGLGGCYLMPIRGTQERPEYNGQADALSDNFWHMIDYSFAQADSLGLDMGIHICDGFALAGGPWITPKESMQKLVSTSTIISGGTGKRHNLMQPGGYEGYYEDIACFAIPSKSYPMCVHPDSLHEPRTMNHETQPIITFSPEVTRDEKETFRATKPCWIQYEYPEEVTFRSVEIVPAGNNLQSQRLRLTVSNDGRLFRLVKQFTPPRQGWQNTDYNLTFAIPKTSGRFFRFEWTPEGTEPGAEDLDAAKWSPVLKVKDIRLSDQLRINQWEGKAGYVWRIGEETTDEEAPEDDCPKLSDIIRIEIKDGRVAQPLPEGSWLVVRIGHTSTGHTNATAGGAKGLECDKFSAEAVRKQVAGWFGKFKERPHADVVKYLHVDSWECGSQNWSDDFAQEFLQRRGYDLLPWLPVMVGIPLESAVKSEQVLRDVRQTINELLHERFFQTVRDCAQEYGVQLSCESVAPTMVADGMEHYKFADVPMGEYWLNSPTHDKPNDMLDAISGGHVYGKNIIQAEAFTEVRGTWDETPASTKALLDRNFALGINRIFFHVFTHNPWLDKKPGMTLDGIGLFFQRDQTWFPEVRGLVDYVTRCQKLLQEGKPVTDIAVYTGEEMPRRAFTPDRLVPMLPGLFGTERIASERQRLANHGLPMIESPVGVRHSACILDLRDWINPLHGYQYDSMNKDALLTQPFHYRVLVVPEWLRVSPEAQTRIDQLRQQGVLIIDKPYTAPTFNSISPDIILPEGIAYTHRATDKKDIYFLSNQTGKTISFQPVFRNGNCQQPVIYLPLTDETKPYYKGTISMQPDEAIFVIFDQEAGQYPVPVTTCLQHRQPKEKFSWSLKKGWEVTFKESGVTLHTDTLFDWSRHADDKIRYFSGHARYTTSFKYKGNTSVTLSLGEVHDIAHVWVNGIDCGIAWTVPYEVDITKALKKGKNKLEIEVVNTWHNALRGADQGKLPYDGIWTNAKYRTKGDGLLPAGLLEAPVIKVKR